MYNQEERKISRIKDDFKGDDLKIAFMDGFNGNYHGHRAKAITKDVLSNAEYLEVDMSTVPSARFLTNFIQKVIDFDADILNVSMPNVDLSGNKLWGELIKNTIVVSSGGNKSMHDTSELSKEKESIAISACYLKDGEIVYDKDSSYHEAIDFCNFSRLRQSYDGELFYRSSCSTPYTSIMVGQLIQWYKNNYGRKPDYKEVKEWLGVFAIDMFEKGEDIKTGQGLPRLPIYFYNSWCGLDFSLLEEKHGINKIFVDYEEQPNGNYTCKMLRNSILTAEDFKEKLLDLNK